MVKHLLIASMASLALNAFAADDTTVLWSGEVALDWGKDFTVPADLCSDIIAGDKIIVTVSQVGEPSSWPQMTLISSVTNTEIVRAAFWLYSDLEVPYSVEMEVPYDKPVIDALQSEGFYGTGCNATVTKLEVLHCGDPSIVIPDGNILFFSPNPKLINWNDRMEIAKEKVSAIQPGQYVNVSVTGFPEGTEWPALIFTADWSEFAKIELFGDDFVDAVFPITVSFQMSQEFADALVGVPMRIGGPGAYINCVTYSDAPASAVKEIIIPANPSEVKVFNLQGVCVKTAKSVEAALEALPKGIYIVNGKKIVR